MDDYTFEYEQTGMISSYKIVGESALDLQQLFAAGSEHKSSSFSPGWSELAYTQEEPGTSWVGDGSGGTEESHAPRGLRAESPSLPQQRSSTTVSLDFTRSSQTRALQSIFQAAFSADKAHWYFLRRNPVRSQASACRGGGDHSSQMWHFYFCTEQVFERKWGRTPVG